MEPNRLRWEQFWKFIRPLGDDDSVLFEQLIPTERYQLARGFESVEIQVKYAHPSAVVFVHQTKSRTRHCVSRASSRDESLRPMRFSRPEIADERKHVSSTRRRRSFSAKSFHRFR